MSWGNLQREGKRGAGLRKSVSMKSGEFVDQEVAARLIMAH
jgi:hypothetical protein